MKSCFVFNKKFIVIVLFLLLIGKTGLIMAQRYQDLIMPPPHSLTKIGWKFYSNDNDYTKIRSVNGDTFYSDLFNGGYINVHKSVKTYEPEMTKINGYAWKVHSEVKYLTRTDLQGNFIFQIKYKPQYENIEYTYLPVDSRRLYIPESGHEKKIWDIQVYYDSLFQSFYYDRFKLSPGRKWREIATKKEDGSEFLYFQRFFRNDNDRHGMRDEWYKPNGELKLRIRYDMDDDFQVNHRFINTYFGDVKPDYTDIPIIEVFHDSLGILGEDVLGVSADGIDFAEIEDDDRKFNLLTYRSRIDNLNMLESQGIVFPQHFIDNVLSQFFGWDMNLRYNEQSQVTLKILRYSEVKNQSIVYDYLENSDMKNTEQNANNEIENHLISTNVQIKANFPGGEAAFRDYVASEFIYPQRCQDEGINGAVMLRFVVDEVGRISGVQAIEETKSCPEFTSEAIRVLKKSPRWVPGQSNGIFVKSWAERAMKLSVDDIPYEELEAKILEHQDSVTSVRNPMTVLTSGNGFFVVCKYYAEPNGGPSQLVEVMHISENYNNISRKYESVLLKRYLFKYDGSFCVGRYGYEVNKILETLGERIDLDSIVSLTNGIENGLFFEKVTSEYRNTKNDTIFQTNYISNNEITKGLQIGRVQVFKN